MCEPGVRLGRCARFARQASRFSAVGESAGPTAMRTAALAFPTAPSNASEPVIALGLPVAAGILVGDLNRLQVLGVLEAELGGDAKPQRCAPLRRQRLFLEIERQNGLRLQRAGHVDAGRIAIEAFEIDVAGRKVGADAAEKRAQRHAAPLADLAPALDADMPGDLPLLRQGL